MAIDLVSEQQLAAIRGGDRRAFERLFRAWYGRLADYTVRVVDDADTAEDVVQAVFIAIWKSKEQLPDGASLPAYLHRACRNRALNAVRDRRRAATDPYDAHDEPGIAPSVEVTLHVHDLEVTVQQALNALAPRTREVFLLSRVQALTYGQIADTLGISVKTVETLMGRALRALREQLRPQLLD